MDGKTEKGRGLTRRDFLEGTGAALVVAGAAPKFVGAESSDDTSKQGIPLLYQRSMVNGKATAYVCRNNVCMLPVNEPSALLHQMGIVQA